jgi:trehalose 6-phosphate synthase
MMASLFAAAHRTHAVARSDAAHRLARNPMVRYALLGIVAAVLVMAMLVPVGTAVIEGWSRRDVELRSRLLFRSIRDQIAATRMRADATGLAPLFDRIAEDERILALGICNDTGGLVHATRQMPRSVTCRALALGVSDAFTTLTDENRRIHVGAFRLAAEAGGGHLLVLHDLAFADARVRTARLYTVLSVAAVAGGVGLLAVGMALALVRSWTRSMREVVSEARHGRLIDCTKGRDMPAGREIAALIDDLRGEKAGAEGIHVEWSPKMLHRLLDEELPDAEVLVVSNREPYIHNRTDAGITLQTPASGLVAALEPVMRACGGTWIAHGSGSADRETVDAHDRVRVPPADPAYALRRVWLSEAEQDGYYYGFANEGLWPLCHIAFVRPTFREQDWQQYQAVNARFADSVVEEAGRDDPIVLVQDYHFALLPRMIRERLPRATVVTFWHIPWPNAETFGICPWRDEIIDGLLGSTILGFHTRFHCNNFLEATDRFMESRIDREHGSITLGGHETMIRSYPISIEWPPAALAGQAPPEQCRAAVVARYGLPADARIAVGVERFDYTKGILDRVAAIDDLLTRSPDLKGKLVYIQAASPTRSKLGAYSALQDETVRLAGEINARHGGDGWSPIVLSIRHHEPHEVFELFRAADTCIVSSLHDGMNLVAKEFVASRDDEHGVLILSGFAGASRELSEALIVNPYDTRSMAAAIERALGMPAAEQRERMRLMRDQVRQRNVYRWAAQMLLDAARLRKRERIVTASES